jgi:hypothetical protein
MWLTPAERLSELEATYRLRFHGHGRLTRDVRVLDGLRSALLGLADDPATDEALHARIAQLREDWQNDRAGIAQAQAQANAAELQASHLTLQARLVLHRYVRHFSGRPRRNRDQALLAEIVADLQRIGGQLRPLRAQLQLTVVQQEVDAIGEFIGFFLSERGEVAAAWQAGSLADRSRAAAECIEELAATWQALVASTPPALRRPETLQRMVASLAAALDTLHGLQHANLPAVHSERIARASGLSSTWQSETDRSAAARARLPTAELGQVLAAHAAEVVVEWQASPDASVEVLCGWCDRLDDLERQLRALTPEYVAAEVVDGVRDALVVLERSHDLRSPVQPPQ